MAKSVALSLGEWIAGFPASAIPPRQGSLAWLRLMDTVGLILGACDTPPARAVAEVAARQILGASSGTVGATGATVVGSTTRLPEAWAAFIHGTIAHCRDFDDTFPDAVVHAGSTAVTVALAVGEATGAAADEIIAAITLGYELAARLGRAGGRGLHARGFHATGIYGPLIAAGVAGRLYGSSGAAIAQSMGLAASMSGGLLEFLADGSWSKWLHVGWSAFGGIMAAQLARQGFPGPVSAIDGSQGLFAAFVGPGADLSGICADLGQIWHGDAATPKYFPCAHVIQPYIAAIIDLRAEYQAGDVASIDCAIAAWAVPIVCEPIARKRQPQTEMDVIASLPFLVAAAWADGVVGLDILSEAHYRRPDLLELSGRVNYRVDPDLGHGFDGSVEVTMADGSRLRRAAPLLPLDPQRLTLKFEALARRALPAERVDELSRSLSAPTEGTLELVRRVLREVPRSP